jgi:hypothetical protein
LAASSRSSLLALLLSIKEQTAGSTGSSRTQIYESFTEGFDTVDLREAKALLDELS